MSDRPHPFAATGITPPAARATTRPPAHPPGAALPRAVRRRFRAGRAPAGRWGARSRTGPWAG